MRRNRIRNNPDRPATCKRCGLGKLIPPDLKCSWIECNYTQPVSLYEKFIDWIMRHVFFY